MHRYAFDRAPPRVDECQDIINPMAQEVSRDGNIHTVITFTSPLDRSNPDDISLNQRLYILYAWGMENNGNESDPMSISRHGGTAANRGVSDTPISILCEGTLKVNSKHTQYYTHCFVLQPLLLPLFLLVSERYLSSMSNISLKVLFTYSV